MTKKKYQRYSSEFKRLALKQASEVSLKFCVEGVKGDFAYSVDKKCLQEFAEGIGAALATSIE